MNNNWYRETCRTTLSFTYDNANPELIIIKNMVKIVEVEDECSQIR